MMARGFYKTILYFGFVATSVFFASASLYAWDGLAILGDSISTGAGSHPVLEFDSASLWRVMTGELNVSAKASDIPHRESFKIGDTLDAPRRLWPSSRENDGASGWVWLHASQAISRTALDTEEYAFGYLSGRGLGLSPGKIWFAGDNGTKMDHALIHAARILDAGKGELPTRVLLLYTGNDLCAQAWDAMTTAEEYGDSLLQALFYLARNGHSAVGEQTTVYIPAFLPVTALLLEDSINAKVIKFHGTALTCAEAKKRMFTAPEVSETEKSKLKLNLPDDPRYSLFAQFMPPNPALLCPTLFARTSEDAQRQSLLANRIRAYRDAQKKAVAEFTRLITIHPTGAKIEAVYMDATESIRFMGDDVAGDCFHLSPSGHAKVASVLLKTMH